MRSSLPPWLPTLPALGAGLAPLGAEVPLAAGEVAYGELVATGWRYAAADQVTYDRRVFVAGGLVAMACWGFVSAWANRRRRRRAEADAAAQWRPLGMLRVVVCSDRLLVWHRGAWWPVWFAGIVAVNAYTERATLDLLFAVDPPYRLAGPQVPALAAVLGGLATVEAAVA
jgi:hypothetical protein